ncbi:MAG: hypothetical protein K8R59_09450 [Thermoanaerobaculales bacterium]|nr:hypothetical protein [Thermoanaerobaculales bacterium]
MPRRPRLMIEGGLYHVYNRCARGEDVFGDLEEAARFVERLREVKARDGRAGLRTWLRGVMSIVILDLEYTPGDSASIISD